MGLRVTWNGSEIGLGMGLGHHALLLRSFIILHSQTHSHATPRLIPKPFSGSFPIHSQTHSQATLRLVPKPLSDFSMQLTREEIWEWSRNNNFSGEKNDGLCVPLSPVAR